MDQKSQKKKPHQDKLKTSYITKKKHGGGVLMPRRNSAEPTHVRTVNEGFDHLREFVPCSIGTGRRAKISKVETLRSAMEYIRALEGMLGIQFNDKGERVELKEEESSVNQIYRDSGNNSSDSSSPPRSSFQTPSNQHQNQNQIQTLQNNHFQNSYFYYP